YRYGEQWWEEYLSDRQTELLLHFGPPRVAGRTQVKSAIDKKQQADLLEPDLTKLGDGKDSAVPTLKLDVQLPPVDESKSAPGMVIDYSNKRRTISLPAG